MLTSPAPRRGSPPPAQRQQDRVVRAPLQAQPRTTDDSRLLTLLEAVATGERDALAAIYDLMAPRVLATMRSLMDEVDEMGDQDAIERVVVDTFSQVWRQAPPMAARGPDVAAWVLAIAVQCGQRSTRTR